MLLPGLGLWQSFAVVIAGNLLWLLVGVQAISGPVSGTPSGVVTRAMFGIRANRVNNAIVGWMIAVAYEAINLTVGALAGFAFMDQIGLHIGTPVKFLIVLLVTAAPLIISVYGHATIVRASGVFTVILGVSLLFLAVCVLNHTDWQYHPAAGTAVHGAALWATIAVGFTIIASTPLSWGTGADYARYLPAGTSAKAVAAWTTAGGFIPTVLLGAVGVLAGTTVDMTDPQNSLKTLVPGWFYPVFLLVVLVSSITNNILTAYSSGLGLQAVGIKWKRSVTVLFDGVVAVAIASYALFISNFLDTLNNILTLSVTLLAPGTAIYVCDIILRRNRYNGLELHDETPNGPFWYDRGINWAGVLAMLAGFTASLLCVDTSILIGPVASRLDGADLSSVTGPIVAPVIYTAMTRRRERKADGVPVSDTVK